MEQKDSLPQDVPDQPLPNAKKRRWIIIGGVLIVLLLFLYLLSQNVPVINQTSLRSAMQPDAASPTPTPFPFVEMTIPHLRERTYTSKLKDLNQLTSNGSYTSYLTSYQSDGLKINGLLTIPDGDASSQTKYPAIIFIHGYIPPTLYRTSTQYSDYIDYLAREGFVVFKIDLRGHADSEGEPGGGYYSSDYIIDTLNARAALASSDFVNPNAIGLWGHSMSGNIVMRSFAAMLDIPGVVIWAGAVYTYQDMQKYGIDDNSYRPPSTSNTQRRRRTELFNKEGSPSAQSIFWQQVTPTNYLDDLKGAIEIHHAVDDPVVNIGYSRDLMALFDKTSVSHELFEYPSGGHNISGSSFNLAMQRTVEFFKKYLH